MLCENISPELVWELSTMMLNLSESYISVVCLCVCVFVAIISDTFFLLHLKCLFSFVRKLWAALFTSYSNNESTTSYITMLSYDKQWTCFMSFWHRILAFVTFFSWMQDVDNLGNMFSHTSLLIESFVRSFVCSFFLRKSSFRS